MKDGLRFVDSDMHINVSANLLRTVPREVAAQIFLWGAHLYGFTETDFAKAAAAARHRPAAALAAGS